MNVLPDLRESLVRAAARQSAPVARRARLRTLIPAGAAVVVTILVAAIALIALHSRGPVRAGTGGTAAARRALIDELAPLRRRQVPGDLRLRGLRTGQLSEPGATVDLPLVRYVGTAPWGERFYVVPYRSDAGRRDVETLWLDSNGGGAGGITPAEFARVGVDIDDGAGRCGPGRCSVSRIVKLLPDGVARVTLVLARQPDGNEYGGPVYAHVGRVTVPVHGNLLAFEIGRPCCAGMIWYAANGRVIRTLGSPSAAARVRATPQPGPPTALSRAAERNPATPNRVWVTPAQGGPATVFRVHFGVLLNGADYMYRVSGTRCPGYTFAGGEGDPNALRGSTWSGSLQGVTGRRLCPGHYRVSVSVGPAPHPAFGQATFVVR